MKSKKTNSKLWHKVVLLLFLYMSQGLPFGFQATALPVYLRKMGISLTVIGFAGALALPWLFKPLLAPLVDRYWNRRVGKRRSWIIPLQVLVFISICTAALSSAETDLAILLASVFFMNLFAAAQDIAVDGLAVDILTVEELGPGNAAQVIGYKIGMLSSGGLLVWLSAWIGWQGLFACMAVLSIIPLVMVTAYNENRSDEIKDISQKGPERTLKEIFAIACDWFREPGARWFILFVMTYKTGEIMIDIMFKPFLVDSGFTASQIGLWVGTWGMAASLFGSLAGGYLARRVPLLNALIYACLLRAIPLVLEMLLTVGTPEGYMVVITTILEHFFGGMLTTVMFANMMSRVDRRIGATHYTVIASIEVLGKSPGTWMSGILADKIGYTALFAVGVVLSLVILPIFTKLKDDDDTNE